MQFNQTQVLPQTERQGESINWDDVRIFLVVARLGSLRAAATETGLSVNAVRRRLDALERETSSVLFARSVRGMILTEEGERVAVAGEAMMQQARVLAGLSQRKQPGKKSAVKVGITEGLGTFWLIPRVVEFLEAEPSVQLQLRCDMTVPNIAGLQVDVAIQLTRPVAPDLIVAHLGYLHLCLFASRAYIERFGAPATRQEVSRHSFIELVGEQIASEKFAEHVTTDDKRSFVGLQVNTTSAQVQAVLQGAGITALPSYAGALSSHLVHVVEDLHITRDIWLAFHPRAGELQNVRQVIEWVKRCFDPVRYPWFREEFVAPSELRKDVAFDQSGIFRSSNAYSG